jgi:hypothetical protein
MASHALPPYIEYINGIRMHDKPLTECDIVLNDPNDMRAIDRVILAAVNHKRANMDPEGRLYIKFGEGHLVYSHTLAQQGLLDNLHATTDANGFNPHGKIMVALETPYNQLQDIAAHNFELSLPSALKSQFHKKDPMGLFFLKAKSLANQSFDIEHHHTNLYINCLRHGIPVCLADLGKINKDTVVDPNDPMTQIIAKDWDIDLEQSPLLVSPAFASPDWPAEFHPIELGFEFRNEGSVRRTVAKAQESNAKTIILKHGAAHIGGEVRKKWRTPYRKSTISSLKLNIRPQDKILSINFNHNHQGRETIDRVPPNMWKDNPDHVIIRNASEETDGYHSALETFAHSYASAGDQIPDRFSLHQNEQQSIPETQKELTAIADELASELGYCRA